MQAVVRLSLLAATFVERGLLWCSYLLHKVWGRRGVPSGFVVGVEEIAGLVNQIGTALDGALTVNLFAHPFQYGDYTHEIRRRSISWSARLRRMAIGPWLLGRLASDRQTFVYVGGKGFLTSARDGREWEFSFLKARGRHVICYFAGSEIRSYELLDEFAAAHEIDVITTYQRFVQPALATPRAETLRRLLCSAADRHASLIFNAPVDQMTHLTRETQPFLYFLPDDSFRLQPDKWADVSRLRVVHAPSSPIIKGTPLVRAAVKALREEGYSFDYTELQGRTNLEVLAALREAHVVLNQFYAFLPGVLGIEALAANAVVLTSADESKEPSLFPGANKAWVVTPYWAVYQNLKSLLDDPAALQEQADRGTRWAARHCSQSSSRDYLLERLPR